jgi:hypothetical protein
MKINSLYKFLLIISCFCSLQVLAMEKAGKSSGKNLKNKKIKKSSTNVAFGKGAHKKFINNGHYVSSGIHSRDSVMCLYCADVFCRSDRGRNHIFNFHDVDCDCGIDDQDFEKVIFPKQCQYKGCSFEFKDVKSFLEHIKSHTEDFKKTYVKNSKVSKKGVGKKRKRDFVENDSYFSDDETGLPGLDEEFENNECLEQECSQVSDEASMDREKKDNERDFFINGSQDLGAKERLAIYKLIEFGEIKRGPKNKFICSNCCNIFTGKKLVEDIVEHLQDCSQKYNDCESCALEKESVENEKEPEDKRRKLN